MKKFWNLRTSQNEILIYGDIVNDKFSETDVTAREFADDLNAFDEVTLRINSNGGDVFVALAIMNLLKDHKGAVTAKVDGVCASAATLLLCGADKVISAKNALFMTHLPTVGLLDYYNEQDLATIQEALSRIKSAILDAYKVRIKENVVNLDVETWYSAEEAKAIGFVDEIAEEIPQEVNDSQKLVILNSLTVKGDYGKIKEKIGMKKQTIMDKITALLQKKPQVNAESERVKVLNSAKKDNPAVNAIIEAAVKTGATLAEITPYLNAVENMEFVMADEILKLIEDNLKSGAEGVGGSYENATSTSKNQNDPNLIAKYLK